MKLRTYRRGVVAIATVTALGFGSVTSMYAYEKSMSNRVDAAYRNIVHVVEVRRLVSRADSRNVNYIVTKDVEWARQRDEAIEKALAIIPMLQQISFDEAHQAKVAFLDSMIRQRSALYLLEDSLTAVPAEWDGPIVLAQNMSGTITGIVAQIIASSEQVIIQRNGASDRFNNAYVIIIVGLSLAFMYFLIWVYREFLEEVILVEKMAVDQRLLIKELNHRVKNSLQNVASVLRLQLVRLPEREAVAIDALKTASMRVAAVGKVHEMLYELQTSDQVDAQGLITHLTRDFQKTAPVELHNDLRRVDLHLDHAVPLALLLNELLTNTIKYGSNDTGRVEAEIKFGPAPGLESTHWQMIVHDSGPGFPDGFSINKAKTLGYKLVRGLCLQLNAECRISNDEGAKFEIIAPVSPPRS